LVISECLDKDVFVLERDTPAFDVSQIANGAGRLSRLPRGAKLRLCGEGLNERMAKVIWNGITYCVYWRDLQEEIAEPISAL
jgi:hypothetical protein